MKRTILITLIYFYIANVSFANHDTSGKFKAYEDESKICITFLTPRVKQGNNYSQISHDFLKSEILGKKPNMSNNFVITRTAGKLKLTGVYSKKGWEGSYTFEPNFSFIQQLNEMGYNGLNKLDLLLIFITDVNKTYFEKTKAFTNEEVSLSKLKLLSLHQVNLSYISNLKSLGYHSASLDELINMKKTGVCIPFIEGVLSYYPNIISFNNLIKLRKNLVCQAFLKDLQSLGYKHLSIDELTKLKKNGICVGYIQRANQGRDSNLTIVELIENKKLKKEKHKHSCHHDNEHDGD